MLKDKKGSHVGMVLSFTIFILALVFIYVIIGTPLDYTNQKGNSLLIIKNNLFNEISADIYTFRINNDSSCVSFSNPFSGIVNESVVAYSNNQIVASTISGNSILVDGQSQFTKVFYSGYFENPSVLSETGCLSTDVLSLTGETVVFEKKILSVFDKLFNNETALRETLNVPLSNEIDIIFTYQNGTTISGNKNEPKENIYSYNEEIYYYTINASEEKGELSLRVW